MGKATLIAFAVLLTAAVARQEPSRVEGEASGQKVKELQRERLDVLRSAAEVSTILAQNARIKVSDVLEDSKALLDAELEAAETEAERVSLCTKAVDLLKELEALAKAQKEFATGTELDLLRIKARRLDVEILLERAKIKGVK